MLEVNALKFAYNRSVSQCAAVSLHAILSAVHAAALRTAGGEGGQPPRKALLQQLKRGAGRWAPLLRRYADNAADQLRLLEALEVRRAPARL